MNRDEVLALIDSEVKRLVRDALIEHRLISPPPERRYARHDPQTWELVTNTTLKQRVVLDRNGHWAGVLQDKRGLYACNDRRLAIRPADVEDPRLRAAMRAEALGEIRYFPHALPPELWATVVEEKAG